MSPEPLVREIRWWGISLAAVLGGLVAGFVVALFAFLLVGEGFDAYWNLHHRHGLSYRSMDYLFGIGPVLGMALLAAGLRARGGVHGLITVPLVVAISLGTYTAGYWWLVAPRHPDEFLADPVPMHYAVIAAAAAAVLLTVRLTWWRGPARA